jgi:hypothetical protein
LAIWAYAEKQIDPSGHPAYIGAILIFPMISDHFEISEAMN